MEKQTVFIKRCISKGELPTKEGRYIVSNGLTWFEVSYCKEYSFHEEFTDCSDVEVWLEEIELPSDEEIKKEADRCFRSTELFPFKQGANFILNHLK